MSDSDSDPFDVAGLDTGDAFDDVPEPAPVSPPPKSVVKKPASSEG